MEDVLQQITDGYERVCQKHLNMLSYDEELYQGTREG